MSFGAEPRSFASFSRRCSISAPAAHLHLHERAQARHEGVDRLEREDRVGIARPA